MTAVTPRDGESFEAMLKRFSKKVEEAGIVQEIKARQAYVKPSDAKRKERMASRSRIKKKQAKMEQVLRYESENKFRPKRRPEEASSEKKPSVAPPQRDPSQPKIVIQPRVTETPSQESLKGLQDKFSK